MTDQEEQILIDIREITLELKKYQSISEIPTDLNIRLQTTLFNAAKHDIIVKIMSNEFRLKRFKRQVK